MSLSLIHICYVDEYGSEEGNTVMITDQDEAWIVEIYGGHQYLSLIHI